MSVMDHKDTFELLESYSLGILNTEETKAIEAHLSSGCQQCTEQLRELGELSVRLADSLPQHEPDGSVKDRLMGKIRSQSGSAKKEINGKISGGWLADCDCGNCGITYSYFQPEQITG